MDADFRDGNKPTHAGTGDDLSALLHSNSTEVLLELLDNPALDETQLCLLLARKDLPGEVLE